MRPDQDVEDFAQDETEMRLRLETETTFLPKCTFNVSIPMMPATMRRARHTAHKASWLFGLLILHRLSHVDLMPTVLSVAVGPSV